MNFKDNLIKDNKLLLDIFNSYEDIKRKTKPELKYILKHQYGHMFLYKTKNGLINKIMYKKMKFILSNNKS